MAAVRRLTAILAADVAGYSRLLGTEEEGRTNGSKGTSGNWSIYAYGCALVRMVEKPILASANPALGGRLPGDEDFTTRCDKARNETLGARGEEFIEPGFQYRTQPAFEVGLQRPERPLVTAKACDPRSDGSLTCWGWG